MAPELMTKKEVNYGTEVDVYRLEIKNARAI